MATAVPAVTFDLWHTLLYLDPPAEDVYNRRQVELGVAALEASPVDGLGGVPVTEAFRTACLEALTMSEQGTSMHLADQIARAAALCGRRVDPGAYLERLEGLVAASPFQVAPGALETMERIQQLGIRIGVVANTVGEPGRALRRICERTGLGKHVSGWSWSDELPWTKPAPQIFLHCLAQLGAVPSRSIHVGDGSWDIEGARATGYRASVLYTGQANYGEFYRTVVMHHDPALTRPDYTLVRMDQIPALVGDLLGPLA